jgi:hypothetical protein
MKESRQVMTSSNKRRIPFVTIGFIPLLIILTLLRILQYRDVIDSRSGFFIHGSGFLGSAYYLGFVICALTLLLFAIADRSALRGLVPNVEADPKKSAKKNIEDVLAEAKQEQSCRTGSACSEGCLTTVETTKQKPKGISPKRIWHTSLTLPVAVIGAILTGFCGTALTIEFYGVATAGDSGWVPLAVLAAAALSYTFIAYAALAYRKLVPVTALALLFIAGHNAGGAALEFMERSYTSNLTTRLVILSVGLLVAVFMLSAGRMVVRSETRFTAYSATVSGYCAFILIVSDFVARLVHYFSLPESCAESCCNELAFALALCRGGGTRGELLEYASVSGFELPGPFFIAQGLVILWLLYLLSAAPRGATPPAEIAENAAEAELKETEETDEIEETIEEVGEDNPESVGDSADSDRA